MHALLPSLATALLLAGSAAVADINLLPPADYSTPGHPWGIASGDFDGDGDIDVAVTTHGPDRISVLHNGGDGIFSGPSDFVVKGGPSAGDAFAADFDGDGDPDIAVCLMDTMTVRIMVNSGGAFTNGALIPVTGAPIWVQAAKLDKNDTVDLVVVTAAGNVCILKNDGHAKFEPATINLGGDLRVAVPGDFDADGDLDLAVSNHIDHTIRILGNNGSGVFAQTAIVHTPDGRPEGLVVADVDGDDDPDIVATMGVPKWGYVMVFKNSGGAFSAPALFLTNSLDPTTIEAGDLDNDGDIDLVTSNEDSGDVSVLANNGDGSYAPPVVIPTGEHPGRPALADYDSDGWLDVALGNLHSSTTSFLLNNTGACLPDLDGSGVLDLFDFLAFENLFNAGDPAADFDGDGALSLFDFLTFVNLFNDGC